MDSDKFHTHLVDTSAIIHAYNEVGAYKDIEQTQTIEEVLQNLIQSVQQCQELILEENKALTTQKSYRYSTPTKSTHSQDDSYEIKIVCECMMLYLLRIYDLITQISEMKDCSTYSIYYVKENAIKTLIDFAKAVTELKYSSFLKKIDFEISGSEGGVIYLSNEGLILNYNYYVYTNRDKIFTSETNSYLYRTFMVNPTTTLSEYAMSLVEDSWEDSKSDSEETNSNTKLVAKNVVGSWMLLKNGVYEKLDDLSSTDWEGVKLRFKFEPIYFIFCMKTDDDDIHKFKISGYKVIIKIEK